MTAPSTDWHETIDEDEAARHARFAQQLVDIQESVDATAGPGRALHRKQVAGVSVVLEVLDDLPAHARQGLFATPATYPGFARLSNGGIKAQPDVVPDIRGLALSFRGVHGESALGGPADRQDFVLINRPAFGFPDSQQFTAIVPALARSNAAFLAAMVEQYGPLKAPLEGARLAKDLLRPFSGFATEPFFSAAPLRWGDYAARVRLLPESSGRRVTAALDFAKDMAERLAAGPVSYELQAQFFVSEELTPIENGLVDWPQDVSEYVTVGRVVMPGADLSSPESQALAARIEQDRFDPWSALAAHRPLGEIMRARKAAYYPSQKHRDATGT